MRKLIIIALVAAGMATSPLARMSVESNAAKEFVRIGCMAKGDIVTNLRLRSAARCARKALRLAPSGDVTDDLITAMKRLPSGAAHEFNAVATPSDPSGATRPSVPQTSPATPTTTTARQQQSTAQLPTPLPVSQLDRNMKIARTAWERIKGFSELSAPGKAVIRDFMPEPLSDGTIVVRGLGLLVREVNGPPQGPRAPMLEIIAVQEFGPAWKAQQRGGKFAIGGYLGGNAFSLDQSLRTALSRSGAKKLRQGFSFPVNVAIPFQNHKNEPRIQNWPMRLRVDPMVRSYGKWIYDTSTPEESDPDQKNQLDALIASFRAKLSTDPCALSNREALDLEREIELLQLASGVERTPIHVFRERDTACAIAKHGAYDLRDLERLAVLRRGTCHDLAGGVSPSLRAHAQDLQRSVAPPNFVSYAKIGIYDLKDPTRRKLSPEEGRKRRACILTYLEDQLFED